MKKINTRDIKVFLFGMLTMFLIELVFDWKDFVKGFNDGMNNYNESKK
ncbi:MAG: hypothetical protein QM734_07555 [Cyclobacteriaceae bacterium]